MAPLLAAAMLILMTVGSSTAAEPTIMGGHPTVSVIDGDTLQIGSLAVQLTGIDAPELGQVCTRVDRAVHCGLQAALALRKIVSMASAPIVCAPLEAGSRTPVATCVLGERDISLTLIEGGYALSLPDAPAAYHIAEERAKAAGIGLWGGTFRSPATWRAENHAQMESRSTKGICLFYGHTDEHGRRRYYGPLDPNYQRVIGDTRQSGPTFCSDDEARESGWVYGE